MSYYDGNYGGYGGHNPGGYYGGTAFPEFDRNGDGLITKSDFVMASRQNGSGFIGEAFNRAAFNSMDHNHDGVLDNREVSRHYGRGDFVMNRGHRHHHYY